MTLTKKKEQTCLLPMHTGQPVLRLTEQRQEKVHVLGQIANIKINLCFYIVVFAICCRLSLLIQNEKILLTQAQADPSLF